MNVTQFFTASLTNPTMPELHAVQGDAGRTVTARLFAGTEPWMVPEGVTAWVSYELPDGTGGCYDALHDGTPACTISENLICAVIAPGLCRESGTVQAAIVLRKGDRQISTFPFQLLVAERPGDPELDPGPDAAPLFAGMLFFGDGRGNPVPLAVGAGMEISEGELTIPNAAGKDYVDEQLAALRADLEYEPISITEVIIEPSVAQMGQEVVNPTVSWTVSREPVEQCVDAESVDPGVREHVVEQSFRSDSFVTVQVTDERGAVASKPAGMKFYNAVYYTDHWTGQEPPTDAQLRAMTTRLQAGRGVTINAEAGDGEYVLYACPSRMGTPEFWANGFQGGFEKLGSFLHTNAEGYAENYDVWLSNAAGLNITITVK